MKNYMKGSGEDRGKPHQHDFEILRFKVNLMPYFKLLSEMVIIILITHWLHAG